MTFSFDQLRLVGLFTILFAANTIPLAILSKKRQSHNDIRIMLLFVGVYLIHVAGLFNSENFDQGTFELEKKLAMLIFPMAIYFSPRMEWRKIKNVLLSFAGSCVIVMIVCFLVAVYRWYDKSDILYFFYHTLSETVGMHASYLSMYCCFSIAILLFLTHREGNFGQSRKHKVLIIIAIMILILGVLLLSARMQLLILFLGLILYAFVRLVRKYGLAKSLIGSMLIGLIAIFITLLFPLNRERFKQVINYRNEYSISSKWGEQQFRVLIWSCAYEIIKSKPIAGVGTGDGEDMLQDCYLKNEYGSLTYFPNSRFNAHNQFLETAIQLGIGGLLILILSTIIPLYRAWRQENVFYVVFILIFMLSCMTESMLESQSGIIYFAFFNSFLFMNEISGRSQEGELNSAI